MSKARWLPRTMTPPVATSTRAKQTVRLTQKLQDDNNAAIPELSAHIPSNRNDDSDAIEMGPAVPVPRSSEPSSPRSANPLPPVASQDGELLALLSSMHYLQQFIQAPQLPSSSRRL